MFFRSYHLGTSDLLLLEAESRLLGAFQILCESPGPRCPVLIPGDCYCPFATWCLNGDSCTDFPLVVCGLPVRHFYGETFI